MTTRPEVRADVLREFGGYAGTLGATDAAASTIVLPGAWGADGAQWRKNQLVFPDANEGNRIRAVTKMVNGVASFDTTEQRVAIAEGERYELYPADLTAGEVDIAISQILRQTLHPIVFSMPLLPGRFLYEMPSWLEDWRNIRAVHRSESPCVISNENFNSWVDGTQSVPTNWKLVTPAQNAASFAGPGVQLEHSAGVSSIALTQLILVSPEQNERRLALLFDADLKSGDATFSVGSLGSVDASIGRSTYTLNVTVPEDVNSVIVTVELGDGVLAADLILHRVLAQWGAALSDQLRDHGSQSYHSAALSPWSPVTGLVLPAVQLVDEYSDGQMVVHALAPFADITADDQETDAADDLLIHGAIFKLSDREVGGREASVWDRRAVKHGNAYAERATRLRQDPVPDPVRPARVGGA